MIFERELDYLTLNKLNKIISKKSITLSKIEYILNDLSLSEIDVNAFFSIDSSDDILLLVGIVDKIYLDDKRIRIELIDTYNGK